MTTPDTWTLVESGFDVRYNRHYEALLALGSGPLQQRAALEEGLRHDPQDAEYLRVFGPAGAKPPAFKSRSGTYMPGVTGPHPTCRDELINLPALHGLIIYAAGERLDMEYGVIRDYGRRLDLRTGRLTREFTWLTRAGSTLRVRFERFISARRRHVMALRCTVEQLEGRPAELRFVGALDAEVRTNGFDHFATVDITGEHEPITLTVRTNSGIEVAGAALLTSERPIAWSIETEPRWVAISGTCILDPGQSVRISKFAALTSSRHVANAPLDAARKIAWDAAAAGFDRLAAESDAVWQDRWQQTDVVIDGDPESQLALRTSLYHLLRAVVEDEPRCGIDAQAATGETRCGRVTWESDVFVLPLLLYTRPAVGKTLAQFRVQSLPGARRNARLGGYAGARYAWESAPGGDEQAPAASPADEAVHVSADVAYGLWHAHLANVGDPRLLFDVAEVLVETARYWCERVTHNAAQDTYELLGVTGPDEYTPFSRNNAYTNRLAAFTLRLAAAAWQKVERVDPATAATQRERLDVTAEELGRFVEIAGKICMPYDPESHVVLQADDFFEREPLDLERWWPDRSQPLAASVPLERLHRSRVLQQADVLLLMALFPQEFDAEQVQAAYATYAPLTCHDAAVSPAVQALVAAWIGQGDEALRMWRRSAGLDLAVGAAAEGIHPDCAGANWQVAVFGFGGLRSRMQSEILHIDPHLPAGWTALRFPFVWDGQPLTIAIEPTRVTIEHRGQRPLDVLVCGRLQHVAPGEQAVVDIA